MSDIHPKLSNTFPKEGNFCTIKMLTLSGNSLTTNTI